MDVNGDTDTKDMTTLCPYYKNIFGGQEWPNSWENYRAWHSALSMRVTSPKPHYAPLWLWPPGSPACWFHKHWDHVEPNQSSRVANVLVFQDHFTKHMLAYVTPDQTAKTITKFLYGGYISIFGAPTRLLSDRDANFTSSVIEKMCKILGIKWLWPMPYHPQMNGLVERSHQMIMHMGSWEKTRKLTGHLIWLK